MSFIQGAPGPASAARIFDNITVTAGQLTGSKVRSQKAWAYSIGSWGFTRSAPDVSCGETRGANQSFGKRTTARTRNTAERPAWLLDPGPRVAEHKTGDRNSSRGPSSRSLLGSA